MSVVYTKKTLALFLFVALITHASFVLASSTNGTIDVLDRYAWSENTGWIDFGTTGGDVHVTDAGLTGYAYGENVGWISLNCSNSSSCGTVDYKVVNNGEGNLSGYAWSENTGWIDFDPAGGGVTIDPFGEFSGYAWGENTGWICFNCATTGSCSSVAYGIKTDWRPASARSQTSSGGTGPAPSGRGLLEMENFSVMINGNTASTDSAQVTLELIGGSNTAMIKISEDPSFAIETQAPYDPSFAKNDIVFTLSKELGTKTVFVKFCTAWDLCSGVYSDNIILNSPPAPIVIPPAAPKPRVFDLNDDNRVDVNEFNQMMVNWGPHPSGSPSDYNSDGRVDIYDFNLLMINWTL